MKASYKRSIRTSVSLTVLASFITFSGGALAQEQVPPSSTGGAEQDLNLDTVVVRGIRSSLESALNEKRNASNLIEVIQSEDIGKLPDQNLAEVLENVTGVQINREAGVGTGVQIRGTDANRIEINGVSTVASGNSRTGINFEDLPASIISAVEVIKVPDAKTIEGSVGGTVNLRTLRPLDLDEALLAFRAQGEFSDLSDTVNPRVSGTVGSKWNNRLGEFGVVVSGSFAKLNVTQFDPRVDRDATVLPTSGRTSAEDFPFLRIQFLDQQITNFEFETLNFTGTAEWKPKDNLRFYFDATVNDQEVAEQSARAFLSGVGANAPVDATTNSAFDTVNLGTIDGPNGPLELGNIQAVLSGVIGVGTNANGTIDSNLRTTANTGSRLTDSNVFALGGDWEVKRLKLATQISWSTSDTILPNLSTDLDFINPNGPQPVVGRSTDNGVPAIFDLGNGTLQFGIAPNLDVTPTSEQLLDPANYRLRQVVQGASTNDNSEGAFRIDASYNVSDFQPFFTSIDAGYRWNLTEATTNIANNSFFLTSNNSPQFFRPSADQFAAFVIPGPDNFGSADGRELFIQDFLIVDPAASFNDPQAVIDAFNTAISAQNAANGVNIPLISTPSVVQDSFFDIDEETNALYVQANYETSVGSLPIRGNVGLRWLKTTQTSIGNNVVNGVAQPTETQSSYDLFLPRISLVAEPRENVLIRAAVARDVRRPNFDALSTSVTFGTNAAAGVSTGNPLLRPETVWSYDLAAEYYFGGTGIVSLGFFHKRRTDLFTTFASIPLEPTSPTGQIERDITAPCEDGGIFNPNANRNIFSSVDGEGICVPLETTINSQGSASQTGIEFQVQYDLANFEDRLGWASGFGVIGNFTYQDDGGNIETFRIANGDGNALNILLGRTDGNNSTATLDDDVVQERFRLTNLSNVSYNGTVFYDKYGLNFRARYTWRSDFQTDEFQSFNLGRIVDDRGQLNASISYDVTNKITVGLEGINLIREDRTEFCVNDNALLCEQGLTDRRIVFGANVRF